MELSTILQAGGPAAVVCLGWWLSKQFQNIRDGARDDLKAHETRDQERHEENLERFGEINQTLVRLERNGHGD